MLDPQSIVAGGGILVIALIIFAESGLFLGFFLPGDSLLLTAGIVASYTPMNLPLLILAVIIAGIAGDNVNYMIGKRTGPRIFKKEDGIVFHKDNLLKAESFYKIHGRKTVIIARFIPVIRSCAPLVAGAGKMPRKQFVIYNAIGATLWGISITLLGYWLGTRIPGLEDYVEYLLVGLVALSFIGACVQILRDPKARKALRAEAKKLQRKVTRK